MKFSLATLGLTLGACAAQAEDLTPLAARQVSLRSVESVSYYTEEADGFRVVTTLADGDGGTPIRVIATLTDGQSVKLSVPRGPGEMEETLEFVRLGERIVVRDPSDALTASIRRGPSGSN